MLNRPAWFIKRKFLRKVWLINLEKPIVYLYRFLIIALPVLLYAIGIAFGANLEIVSYI